jgi:ABC-type transporter Mla subunit MlaD
MKEKSRNYKIGLFVISAILIFILFVIGLGLGNLFQKNLLLETYFDESVQGLDIGSTVKFRGVKVGTVKEISFVQDKYKLDPGSDKFYQGRYVLVKMTVKDLFKLNNKEQVEKLVTQMATKGLRVKLTSQGITGTSYLEIDYVSIESNPPLDISWDPDEIYVPSTKSTITKIGATMEEFLKKLDEAEIEKIAHHIDQLVITLDSTFKNANVKDLSIQTVQFISEVRDTNSELKKIFSNPKMQNLPDKLNESLTLMSTSMNKLNSMLSSNNKDISTAVENLRLVSEDLKEVISNFKKYPSYSFFAEPPKSSELGKK